jgi:hypothetical protein
MGEEERSCPAHVVVRLYHMGQALDVDTENGNVHENKRRVLLVFATR